MGGTFDPIHFGHLLAAERAREAADLDEVRFMPTFAPPHKTPLPHASPEDRLAMVRLAIADHPQFRLETAELERGGVSYSYDTAKLLTEREPENRWFWIVGGDMVLYLPRWHRIESLAEMVTFLGVTRPGFTVTAGAIPEPLRKRVELIEMPEIGFSSSDIRERRSRGLSIRYAVPEPVRIYIEERGLYL